MAPGRSKWLNQFSVARGRGIDGTAVTKKLQQVFGSISPDFVTTEPDVLAISEKEWWQVECKGTGTGKPNTLRNNFDRALASVVSYYEESCPETVPDVFAHARPFLGLALPDTEEYMSAPAPVQRRTHGRPDRTTAYQAARSLFFSASG